MSGPKECWEITLEDHRRNMGPVRREVSGVKKKIRIGGVVGLQGLRNKPQILDLKVSARQSLVVYGHFSSQSVTTPSLVTLGIGSLFQCTRFPFSFPVCRQTKVKTNFFTFSLFLLADFYSCSFRSCATNGQFKPQSVDPKRRDEVKTNRHVESFHRSQVPEVRRRHVTPINILDEVLQQDS